MRHHKICFSNIGFGIVICYFFKYDIIIGQDGEFSNHKL